MKIHITKNDSFMHQIVEYGYFAEELPSCFSSKILAEKLNDLLTDDFCAYKEKTSKNATRNQLTKLSIN